MNAGFVICGIPCLNSERYIAGLVTLASRYVNKVIVVNDGSQDNSEIMAREAGALVINHGQNLGVGAATKTCFEQARKLNADVLVTLDSDNQHDPRQIPLLLEPILQKKTDIVIGSRFLNTHSKIPTYRRIGISIINFLMNFGSPVNISDTQSCFRAYSKLALHELEITESGYEFSVQVLIESILQKLKIYEVPITCSYNEDSHKSNPILHGFGIAKCIVKRRSKSLFK